MLRSIKAKKSSKSLVIVIKASNLLLTIIVLR